MQNGVLTIHTLVFRVLNDKLGRNWALVLKGQLKSSDRVHFGESKVNNWLNEVNNWSTEICLN